MQKVSQKGGEKVAKGKLWVVEGADGTGKATQAQLLLNRLSYSSFAKGCRLQTFPDYESVPWGKKISEYLAGEIGEASGVDPYYASLLYAADRALVAGDMKNALEAGEWIVCDRYIQSNMAYQGVKIEELVERDAFYEWLEKTEYVDFEIPKPDGVIVLELSRDINQERINTRRNEAIKKGKALYGKIKEKDGHEDNLDYMTLVKEEYSRLARTHNWHIIDCSPNGRDQLPPEEISQKIWETIEQSS